MIGIAVIGVTNTGKTTFIEEAIKHPDIAAAQVGKEFRKRYPPGHFRGQGAPEHTRGEALDILDMFIKQAGDAKILLTDGQPRNVGQIEPVFDRLDLRYVLWMHADPDTLIQRAQNRGTNDLDLSMKRFVTDRCALYDVLHKLMLLGVKVIPTIDPFASLTEIMNELV